jgi:hypothetical protein
MMNPRKTQADPGVEHPSARRLAVALAACLLFTSLSGCMTARVEQAKDTSTGISNGESVVILASSYHTGNPAEDNLVECVVKRVQGGSGKLQVYPETEFRDALFPWLEPRTAPKTAEDLPELLERPGVAELVRDRRIRYIVWIQGDTERTSSGGGLSCAVGPGGGGCFGLAWWENQSAYDATVWDLDDGTRAGKVTTSVNGTSVIPAVIVPVPLIARTQAAACKGLAKQLKSFITEDPSTT